MGRAWWWVVLTASCAGRSPSPAPAPSAVTCLILADLTIEDCTAAPAAGLHVRGRLHDGRFSPESGVLGVGELGEAGAPGWVELYDRSFHGAQTARPPFPPYLEGVIGPDGIFRPTSRAVHY